jgi:chromosome partitioning protein
MRCLAFVNQKGGVGKTTSVQNVGAGLARSGKRVLMIDMDGQANLTEGFGINPNSLKASVYDVLINGDVIKDVLVSVDKNLDLVPSSDSLYGAEAELVNVTERGLRLKKAIAKTRGYDFILIDCPPSLGQLTVNSLNAAKEVLIPIETHFYALKGLQKLLGTIKEIKARNNPKLKLTGVFCTLFNGRTKLGQGVMAQIKKNMGKNAFDTAIRENISLAEAPVGGQDIFTYKASSNGAKDYEALCQEIIRKGAA